MLKKLLLLIWISAALYAQHDASINLNNDEIELKGNLDIGEMNESDYPDTYFLTLGFLDVDNDESTDPMFEAGLMLRQNIEAVEGLRFGLGLKGTYTEVANSDHAAIPLGAELEYTLPFVFSMPIKLKGALFYAPSVLSFKDADGYSEGRIELSIDIVEQATLFVGYRNIETDFDGYRGDYTYTDKGYIGAKVRF